MEIVPMIEIAQRPDAADNTEPWHAGFLAMLPQIERRASLAFRDLPEDMREDLIEEVVVNALMAYKRLYDKGKVALAYPSVLALYGIRQVREGRRAGSKMNVRDVASSYAQRKKKFRVERLDKYDPDADDWLEVLVEDRHATPADTAAARIDISDWFEKMPEWDRAIAGSLGMGGSTQEVAREFRVSQSRISRKRREYYDSWRRFQGELPVAAGRSMSR